MGLGQRAFRSLHMAGTGAAGTLVRARKNDFDRCTTNVFATLRQDFLRRKHHNMKIMAGFSAERYTYDNLYAQHKGRYDMLLPDLDLTYGTRGLGLHHLRRSRPPRHSRFLRPCQL